MSQVNIGDFAESHCRGLDAGRSMTLRASNKDLLDIKAMLVGDVWSSEDVVARIDHMVKYNTICITSNEEN